MNNKKVVLVTGASRGIGKSIVSLLAKENYNVVINYNKSEEAANKLKQEIEINNNVLLEQCDITNESEVIKMVDHIISIYGRIDILINNAGIAIDTLFEDKTVENFKKILDVNLIGMFSVTKHVSKYMMDKKEGCIINIGSTNGIDTYYPYSLDYDASKAGVISLTHNLAKQFSPFIRVNCICPGWIDTDMNKDMDEDYKQQEIDKILLKRFGQSDEVAQLVLFLISDKASYINDSIIRIDGGLSK